jgi:hypothetical protein
MHHLLKKVNIKFLFKFLFIIKYILDKKWAEMLEELPENDVRYVVIDIFYETSEGSRAEIYFIAW